MLIMGCGRSLKYFTFTRSTTSETFFNAVVQPSVLSFDSLRLIVGHPSVQNETNTLRQPGSVLQAVHNSIPRVMQNSML